MKRQLILVVVATALLVKFWPAQDLSTPPGAVLCAMTIRGLRLGMTRAEVIQLIGPPLQETESQAFRQCTEARYQKNSWEQDPQVTYSSGGRVVAVVGKSLEWPGTSLAADLAEKKLLGLFPEAVELRQANYHPGAPGMYFCCRRNLMLYTEATGLFSPHRFGRAQLSVPYLIRHFLHPAEFRDPVISATASRIELPNRARLLQAKAIGCFQCCKVLPGKPRWTVERSADVEPTGICPFCAHETLLGGGVGEITPAYLKAVHQAWLEP